MEKTKGFCVGWLFSLLGVALFSTARADEVGAGSEEVEPRIIGHLSDGRVSAPEDPEAVPSATELQSRVTRAGGRAITVKRITTPAVVESVGEVEPLVAATLEGQEDPPAPAEDPSGENSPASEFCIVSATVFDDSVSRVEWWRRREKFVAWSNFNWTIMGGFTEFAGRGQRFHILLAAGSASTESIRARNPEFALPVLPSLLAEGPKYVLMSGNEDDAVALKFMDVLHDLYEAEAVRLTEARDLRREHWRERAAWLEANPPATRDVIIHSWEIENVDEKDQEP